MAPLGWGGPDCSAVAPLRSSCSGEAEAEAETETEAETEAEAEAEADAEAEAGERSAKARDGAPIQESF